MDLFKKSLLLLTVALIVGILFLIQRRKPQLAHEKNAPKAADQFAPAFEAPSPRSPPAQNELLSHEPAVASKLQLLLVGTLVHSNPNQSIAALYFKSSKQTDIFVNKKTVADTLRLEKIERGIIYFINLKNSKYEFLKMSQDELNSFSNEIQASKNVERNGKNSFTMKRKTLEKYMNDLSTTLLTASVLPHKNSLGEIDGFQFVDILSMSVFAQLGFQKGDIIKTVNGELIDSLQKGIETYNLLKNSPGFKIGIERGGNNEVFDYVIQKKE